MNNTFSLARIGLILRSYWIEHKKAFFVSLGLLFIAYFLLLWDAGLKLRINLYWFGFIASIFTYLTFIGKKVHRSKGLSLTLPASTVEKYISYILVGLIYIIAYILVYIITLGVSSLINGLPFFSITELISPFSLPVSLLIFSYFFWVYIRFRKYPLGLGLAIIAFTIALVGRLIYLLAKWGILNGIDSNSGFFQFIENLFKFIGEYHSIILYILAAGMFYLSYVRLKNQQLR